MVLVLMVLVLHTLVPLVLGGIAEALVTMAALTVGLFCVLRPALALLCGRVERLLLLLEPPQLGLPFLLYALALVQSQAGAAPHGPLLFRLSAVPTQDRYH